MFVHCLKCTTPHAAGSHTSARASTKWKRACDERWAILINYIHLSADYWQYCHAGDQVDTCKLGLFGDASLGGDLQDPKSTSSGVLCIFVNRTGSRQFHGFSQQHRGRKIIPGCGEETPRAIIHNLSNLISSIERHTTSTCPTIVFTCLYSKSRASKRRGQRRHQMPSTLC